MKKNCQNPQKLTKHKKMTKHTKIDKKLQKMTKPTKWINNDVNTDQLKKVYNMFQSKYITVCVQNGELQNMMLL